MSLLGSLFGRSPVRPMQQHMEAVVACARVVLPFTEAMAAGDTAGMARHREEIVRLEHQADEIKHEIRSHLPKRLMMAMERRDLLDILDAQDSIADTAQDIAELAEMRGMTIPEAMRDPILALVRAVISTCEQGQAVINELDELVETGFGARESKHVEDMIHVLGQRETEADRLAEAAQRVLFSIEDDLGVSAYYWYRMIDWIGDLADYAERVGNRLMLLIAT